MCRFEVFPPWVVNRDHEDRFVRGYKRPFGIIWANDSIAEAEAEAAAALPDVPSARLELPDMENFTRSI